MRALRPTRQPAPSPSSTDDPTPVPSPREFLFSTLTDSFTFVEPILAADREAIKGRDFYDDAYFAALYEKTGPIMEKPETMCWRSCVLRTRMVT